MKEQDEVEDMSSEKTENAGQEDVPWIQTLYDRIWLIGIAATVFFFVVYVGWGVLDLMMTPEGGP